MRISRRPYVCALLLSGSVLAAGCTGLTKGQVDLDVGTKERGIASWYGDDFHGWITASGEIYDMYQLSGAHRTLPLGTMVRVTNVVNGRHASIRINDRGPYVHGRILDLSYAAAEALDMLHDGISAVQLEVVGHQEWGLSIADQSAEGAPVPWSMRLVTEATWPVPPPDPEARDSVDLPRAIPCDLLRERRVRRVGNSLAAECRPNVVAVLELA